MEKIQNGNKAIGAKCLNKCNKLQKQVQFSNVKFQVNDDMPPELVNEGSDSVVVDEREVVIKFDSACSRNMSGRYGRLIDAIDTKNKVVIKGFNNAQSSVDSVGTNDDGKMEYFVSDMPDDLVLLCANEYALDGAAILFDKNGYVLNLNDEEKTDFLNYIKQFKVVKTLIVKDRVYHVDINQNMEYSNSILEEAYSNTSVKYFNSNVHVSSNEERIMVMMLAGQSFKDLKSMIVNNSINGIPKDLTLESLNRFERKRGTTPSIMQLANPHLGGNKKEFFGPDDEITKVGDRIEMDYFAPDFNERTSDANGGSIKTSKIATAGGAIAGFVAVDVFSGILIGSLVKSVANPLIQIEKIVNQFAVDVPGVQIKVMAGDNGVVAQSPFLVMVPAVITYLRGKGINPKCGEAYSHNNGLAVIERNGRTIKELILFAILYIIYNPNFDQFGFTRRQIFQLWGELFNWSLVVISLKECPNVPGKTKYEVYYSKKPDLRNIRMLPIMAFLYVLRNDKKYNPVSANKTFWQKGLYVGPSLVVKGAVRIVVLTATKQMKVIVSTVFKGVSDGCGVNVYEYSNKFIHYSDDKDDALQDEYTIVPDLNAGISPEGPIAIVDEEVPSNSIPVSRNGSVIHLNSIPVSKNIYSVLQDESNSDNEGGSSEFNISPSVSTLGGVSQSTSNAESDSKNKKSRSHSKKKHKKVLNVPSSEVTISTKKDGDNDDNGSAPKISKLNISTESDDDSMPGLCPPRSDSEDSESENEGMPDLVPDSESDNEDSNRSDKPVVRKKLIRRLVPILKDDTRSNIESRVDDYVKDVKSNYNLRNKKSNYNLRNKKSNMEYDTAKSAQDLLVEITHSVFEESNSIDWSDHDENSYYYCFEKGRFMQIENINEITDPEILESVTVEEGYRAVTAGVPRNFTAALRDPVWGEPARAELDTVTVKTGTLVKVDRRVAQDAIKNGANCLTIIVVYEEKIKDGKLVKKVRMCADGRRHTNVGATYSSTPTREEFLIVIYLVAVLNWHLLWLDENRAFLTAKRQDQRDLFARFPGDPDYYKVMMALYGTKDASRDYQIKVIEILVDKLGFERLQFCNCLYVLRRDGNVVIVLDHVDDFVFAGNDEAFINRMVSEFRKHANTCDPVVDAPLILGMEIVRNRENHTFEIRMESKIKELALRFKTEIGTRIRKVPMPVSGFLVRDYEIEALPDEQKRILGTDEITLYLSIVGALIWLQGVRLDIIFAVLYLSWNTKAPRQHHLDMAYYVIGYLKSTMNMPLVLGGDDPLRAQVFWDSSHGTGPKSRSITGQVNKLGFNSGAISAKASAQSTVKLSAFESELDGATTAIKSTNRIRNILFELGIIPDEIPIIYNDNQATLEFIRGNSVAKGVRHMELRMWYTRLEFQKSNVTAEYLKGVDTVADKCTKLGTYLEHVKFATNIQGLNLLGYDYFKSIFHDAGGG